MVLIICCIQVLLVDFTATWCGPCQIISLVFVELSKKILINIFLKGWWGPIDGIVIWLCCSLLFILCYPESNCSGRHLLVVSYKMLGSYTSRLQGLWWWQISLRDIKLFLKTTMIASTFWRKCFIWPK